MESANPTDLTVHHHHSTPIQVFWRSSHDQASPPYDTHNCINFSHVNAVTIYSCVQNFPGREVDFLGDIDLT
ncbi:hypothetical protein CCACVL1_23436 [Corchorus capsularis]|uniref:Uncharacterized protein n=1 Tax=Corchorus capsularis TaxID=210143 RepID=A0A1R3GTY2_COCAP|nr:hypothetical protein CCACVL1_23436 [Corchorus capsularis]